MEAAAPPLEDLRAEVDRIDQAILELLIERTDVVREIGAVKADRAQRPARGAAGARGGDPAPAGGARGRALPARRCWCACGASCWPRPPACRRRCRSRCSPTAAAASRTWDLARDHFGSVTPMVRVDSASQALRSVSDGSATVAVAAAAQRRGSLVAGADLGPPRPAAGVRAPAVRRQWQRRGRGGERARARPARAGAERRRSGAAGDRGREPASRAAGCAICCRAAGLEPVWLAAWRSPDPPQAVHLVEIGSFVREGDERVADGARRGARRGLADRAGRRLPSPAAAGLSAAAGRSERVQPVRPAAREPIDGQA